MSLETKKLHPLEVRDYSVGETVVLDFHMKESIPPELLLVDDKGNRKGTVIRESITACDEKRCYVKYQIIRVY